MIVGENKIWNERKNIHEEYCPALPRARIPTVTETLRAEPNFVWFRAFLYFLLLFCVYFWSNHEKTFMRIIVQARSHSATGILPE